MPETPTPVPARNPAEIVAEVIALQTPEERRTKIEELIKEQTIDDLEALAKELKNREELQDETKLQEFREEIKKRIDAITQGKEINERLTLLEGRLALIELLPELGRKETLTERASNFVVEQANTVIGFFKDAGGWIGETATAAYNYLADPEKRAELGRMIGNYAKRAWYWALKTPSVLGIPENTPGLGGIAANATEKLAQMDAVDAIYEIVNAEKGTGAKPLVTFDGKFDKSVWLRWKPEERTPEAIQQMALSFIDVQKSAGQGTMTQPIVVTMAALRNPEEAARIAAETLQTELATALGVEKIDFGSPASAKKGTDRKWSLTIAESDVDKAAKRLNTGSTAEKLAPSIKFMPTVDEVVIEPGKEEIEVRKEGGKTKVTASIEKISSEAAHIETLANTIQGGRVTALKVGDPSLKTDVPRAVFSQTNRMLATNEKSMQLGAEQIAKILSEKIPEAEDRQEWRWDGSAWIDEPLPTA
ncbi:MAG: hypothetical protein PHU04_00485 [Candidatus Peribacteraceae bacterium]|nr:hypothetical protein [Candidatus Peribacteraceae bacterium]